MRRIGRAQLLTIVAGLFLVAACSAGTNQPDEANSQQAADLAAQLQTKLAAAGLPQPSTKVLTTLYGVDGGISCTNVAGFTQTDGLALFGNPSHSRRVPLDPSVLAYDVAVISTYCPDQLAALQKAIADQTTPQQTIGKS